MPAAQSSVQVVVEHLADVGGGQLDRVVVLHPDGAGFPCCP